MIRKLFFMLIFCIILLSLGCKKNPTDPTIETDDEYSYLVLPGTYPSFSEYLQQYTSKSQSDALPSGYIIPMSITVTNQGTGTTTCVAHATAYALSITLQNRQPPFYFMGMQFDPQCIIDRAFLSVPSVNTVNFRELYSISRVIDVVKGDIKEKPFSSNPGIESWGIDLLGDYAQFDPVSVRIAQPRYGSNIGATM